MKVLVIGATGRTGSLIVKELLQRGHEVAAFARKAEAITEQSDRLRIVQGDARNAAAIDEAVRGQNAVIVAFGPRSLGKDDIQEVMIRHLLAAMKRHGLKRVINLSAWGTASVEARPHPFMKYLLRPLLLRNVYDDKDRAEARLLASGLDYVNVGPGRLLDEPARGGVIASADGKGLKAVMSRADLARFMVDQLTSDIWVRRSPAIGYSRKR